MNKEKRADIIGKGTTELSFPCIWGNGFSSVSNCDFCFRIRKIPFCCGTLNVCDFCQ